MEPTRVAAEAAMWDLVERHTGRVGYARPVKAEGLRREPPVIDCSGWVALLLQAAMRAWNASAGSEALTAEDIAAVAAWSDRIIGEVERRSGRPVLTGDMSAETLARGATIGVAQDEPWSANHPRARGITHIVQVVHRPRDDAAFVSESINAGRCPGVRLTSLQEWLAAKTDGIRAGTLFAVDPFAMASRPSRA